MGVTGGTSEVELLVARRQIETLLVERGRAADAKDPDAILALHVPGSRDTHGIFDGTIEQFTEYLRNNNYADGRYGEQRHTISNILVEFDSPTLARVESYHLAYHRLNLTTGSYDVQIGGRYLDVCARGPTGWLLNERVVVYDWSRSWPVPRSAIHFPDPGVRVTIDAHDNHRLRSDAANTATSTEAMVAELLAKQQITEVLYRRARAGDRRDVDLALRCYHPDATEEHEGFTGTAADFIRNVSMISPNSTAPVNSLWHFISNVLIDLRDGQAEVESYHIALVARRDGDTEMQSWIGGRYLDVMTFEDGHWAIKQRKVVFDWSRSDPASTPYWELVGLDESRLLRGQFGAGDPLYSHSTVSRG